MGGYNPLRCSRRAGGIHDIGRIRRLGLFGLQSFQTWLFGSFTRLRLLFSCWIVRGQLQLTMLIQQNDLPFISVRRWKTRFRKEQPGSAILQNIGLPLCRNSGIERHISCARAQYAHDRHDHPNRAIRQQCYQISTSYILSAQHIRQQICPRCKLPVG
ncbi:hypothetical protein D3C77_265220 [compost metagenome]